MNKNLESTAPAKIEGILLVDKPTGKTSFNLVAILRKITGVQKIGHAGTLDPFATGVMILLIGKNYTRKSDQFLNKDKEYRATLRLGVETDSYDCDGQVVATSDKVPTLEEIIEALKGFQGQVSQTPPMFSAKKIKGKKLYELARKGIEVERAPVSVFLKTDFIRYEYPELELHVTCSKGTYIRSIAHDLGVLLGCCAHLSALTRTRSGEYRIEECLSDLTDLAKIKKSLLI